MAITDVEPSSLLSRFGLRSFRPGQDSVVEAVLSGQDVMCVMPTGGGKSLCYQLPSLALEGTTIVISPLIALMKDQVDTLQQRGISAALVNSTLSVSEQNDVMRRMAAGEFDLVYVAPERLRNSRFLESLRSANVSLLAVDEAHCISEWGHDFRPDYARLGQFRERHLGNVQTIALTATATPAVRDDISRLLSLREPRMFITGFARDNLRFEVEHCKGDRDKDTWLLDYLDKQNGAGIIYAATRKRCEELAGWLPEKARRPIGVYHAGMEPNQRQAVQEQFMAGKLSAIVATNAFGMGIDKSDLRFVVHYNMPGTLEAYYQEAGRAGRDGKPSECVLLFSYTDRHIQEFFIENRYPTAQLVKSVYEFLLRQERDPIELTLAEVRDAVDKTASPEAIGTAETLLGRAGVLKRLDSGNNMAIVRIDSDLPTLVDMLPKDAKVRRRVLRAVEKVIGDQRFEDVSVQPAKLAQLAEMPRERLMQYLRELSGLRQFDYVPPFRGRAVHVVRRDLRFEELNIDFDELERRKQAEYDKLEAVIGFARTAHCRQTEILGYFGDPNGKKCGQCDRCAPVNPRLTQGLPTASQTAASTSSPADDPDICRGLRVVLSGIARTHGRFGKGLVAQMLCGSQNKKMTQWKLNRLSTYGMLNGLKQTQLTDIIDAMTEIGLVCQVEVEQRRPTVQLTELGREVMMGRQAFPAGLKLSRPLAKMLGNAASRLETTDVTGKAAAISHVSADTDSASSEESDDDQEELQQVDSMPHQIEGVSEAKSPANSRQQDELIARLKHWRRRVSAASGLPAFRVLTNATLERIAQVAPRSVNELEDIPGVGSFTIEEYGFDLIELVTHCVDEQAVNSGVPASAKLISPVAADPFAIEADEPSSPTTGEFSNKDPASIAQFTTAQDNTSKDNTDQANTSQATKISPTPAPPEPDAHWTWKLHAEGYSFEQICQIRRMAGNEALENLVTQATAGHPISSEWVEKNCPCQTSQRAVNASHLSGESNGDSLPELALWGQLERLAKAGGRG